MDMKVRQGSAGVTYLCSPMASAEVEIHKTASLVIIASAGMLEQLRAIDVSPS
jgi:hypothetical protein